MELIKIFITSLKKFSKEKSNKNETEFLLIKVRKLLPFPIENIFLFRISVIDLNYE